MLKKIIGKFMSRSDDTAGEQLNTSIVMYSTRFCPYCVRARGLLASKGWAFEDISVDMDRAKRTEMMEKSGRHTVPQIWIGEQHIGGCDELFHLEVAGTLESLVTGANNE